MEGTVTIPLDDYMSMRRDMRKAEAWGRMQLPDPGNIAWESVNNEEGIDRATISRTRKIYFRYRVD